MACSGPPTKPDTDTDTDTTVDVTLEATVSEAMPTSVTFSVSGDGIEEPVVSYGRDGVLDSQLALVAGDGGFQASASLLKPASQYDWTLSARLGDETISVEAEPFSTGGPPATLPTFSFTAHEDGAVMEGHMVTSILSIPSAAVIIDEDGDYVWWRLATDHGLVTRARLSLDGEAVLFLDPIETTGEDTTYALTRVSLDGAEITQLPGGEGSHHDFVEVSPGLTVQIQHDSREVDGEIIKGDRLVEVSSDGSERVVWSVWDHLSYRPEQQVPYLDWTHANALDYDPDEDALTVSLCSFSTLYHLDRETGAVLWKLGGQDSDFRLSDPSEDLFTRQHQFERTDDGIIVFDNQAFEQQESRVIEYVLDLDAGTATERLRHLTDPPVYTHGLGDVSRLPDGRTRVVWSAQGLIQELSEDGELRWELQASLGGGIGYVTWTDSL